MAEIKIEKKKPVWPWILLILIILAVVAYFIYANNESDDSTDDFNTEEIDTTDNNALYENRDDQDTMNYSDTSYYSESIRDSTRIGTDSTYTKTALHNLARAVTQKASQHNVESFQALEDLKQYASQTNGMTDSTNSNATGMTKNLKTVSMNIVNVLERIQTSNFPALNNEIADLKQTANKLNTDALDRQQNNLQAFFRKANEVLNKMNS